ncbi:fetuin-B [Equus asinus]|uniref:fetuin-B n=1 Tax=Equus asinus TaxID=9793 RepID=UPI0038F80EFF
MHHLLVQRVSVRWPPGLSDSASSGEPECVTRKAEISLTSLRKPAVRPPPHSRLMDLLLPLVLCTLAVCCGARSPPGPPPLFPRGCNDSDVLAASDLALQDINRDQRKGFVLSLNRVSNVYEHRQGDLGSVFYLTLDVLETDCHVLTKKPWKECGVKFPHDTVYGQCKVIFYINQPRIVYTPAYNCTLRPVSRRKIVHTCPDCPGPIKLSDASVLEAALESLAKYNSESTSKRYSLVQVVKASFQWVVGPSYFVEYLITESPCTKSQTESAASKCPLQLPDAEPVGICKGSVIGSPLEKIVSVSCKFFETQVEEPQKTNTAPTNPPSKAVPKGSVQHLPELDDGKPKDSQEEGPVEAFPLHLDLTTNPHGETLDVSFLFAAPGEKKVLVFPFPKQKRRSAECPGPAQEDNPWVLPP